jgi:hypothetical protein
MLNTMQILKAEQLLLHLWLTSAPYCATWSNPISQHESKAGSSSRQQREKANFQAKLTEDNKEEAD